MNRQQAFEAIYAKQHDVPAESLVQYRHKSKEGYSLPGIASHYRTYCEALDSILVELPEKCEYADGQSDYAKGHRQGIRSVVDALTAAGVKYK